MSEEIFLLVGNGLVWSASVLIAAGVVWLGFIFFLRFAQRSLHAGLREYIEDLHTEKGTTPTMGGIVISVVLGVLLLLLYCDSFDMKLLAFFVLLFGSSVIGFWDDFCKVFRGKGIIERHKFIGQLVATIAALGIWYYSEPTLFPDSIAIGVTGGMSLYIGKLGYFFWALWVILSTYNCVNFTDGLDGLAGGVLAVCFAFFGVAAVFLGSTHLVFIFGTLLGAIGAFLWFNVYPARLFMGDVGALSMGAVLGLGALMLRMELAILLVGFVFVLEGVSVVLQILWYRLFKRRLFLLAPIHHHFEKQGVPEVRITGRLILLSLVAAVFAVGLYSVLALIPGV